jgi:hypothetical protein
VPRTTENCSSFIWLFDSCSWNIKVPVLCTSLVLDCMLCHCTMPGCIDMIGWWILVCWQRQWFSGSGAVVSTLRIKLQDLIAGHSFLSDVQPVNWWVFRCTRLYEFKLQCWSIGANFCLFYVTAERCKIQACGLYEFCRVAFFSNFMVCNNVTADVSIAVLPANQLHRMQFWVVPRIYHIIFNLPLSSTLSICSLVRLYDAQDYTGLRRYVYE